MNDGYKAGLAMLGLDPDKYVAGDNKSVRGPCFMCGGTHRMLVFIDKPFPDWWLRCDMCGIEGFLTKFFPSVVGKKIDNSYLGGHQNGLKESLESVKILLNDLRLRKGHLEMHGSLTKENRQWWSNQGIPEDWQDFWKLGFIKDKHISVNGQYFIKDAYSIPKFDMEGRLSNIDYRIINPPLGTGKYRPEPGLPATMFIARPDFGKYHKGGRVIIVEGSKKAMVLAIHLGEQIIGIPACRSWAGVVDKVKTVPEVIVLLDPDAEVSAIKLVSAIGSNAKRVTLPTKPDDGFLFGGLNKDLFWEIVNRSARNK